MTPTVAIIGSGDDDKSVDYLRNALLSNKVESTICPVSAPREVLRWAMDLSPVEYKLCIFADTDGRVTASITTALDPQITPLMWCPAPSDPERLVTILSDTPALLCFAHDPLVIAGLAENLCSDSSSGPASASGGPARQTATIETVGRPVASADRPPSTADHDPEDHALYQQLEAMMSVPIKDRPKPEPVTIQQAGLDFSLPLRRLMTAGRALAQKGSHPEVLAVHYLATLDEPFVSAFRQGGFDLDVVKDYLAGLNSGEEITSEAVTSDEVFEAVAEAKRRARSTNGPCVRVADFLHGLLQQPNTSITEVLEDAGVKPAILLDAIASLDTSNEVCSESFFKPSSLDQANFYQFDPAEVRSVESRLRDLPGFQKAAERVAEARGKQAGFAEAQKTAAAAPTPAGPIAPAVPPDKPELLRVSGEFPDVDVIEQVADRLLEGHVVAFPSDIMYAVAVDATNAAAVEQLRQAASLPPDKPLSILINSTGQLKHLAKANLDTLEPLFDELWPGPLTLVFKGAGAAGRHVASEGTIAVRQPGDNLSLAILSMLGRPLAVTSWEKPKDQLTGHVAAVVNADAPPVQIRTTVVDLTTSPWQVLREGAVPGQSVMRYHKDVP